MLGTHLMVMQLLDFSYLGLLTVHSMKLNAAAFLTQAGSGVLAWTTNTSTLSFGNSLSEDHQWVGTLHKVSLFNQRTYQLHNSSYLGVRFQYALYSRALTSSYLDALFGMGSSPVSHCTSKHLLF